MVSLSLARTSGQSRSHGTGPVARRPAGWGHLCRSYVRSQTCNLFPTAALSSCLCQNSLLRFASHSRFRQSEVQLDIPHCANLVKLQEGQRNYCVKFKEAIKTPPRALTGGRCCFLTISTPVHHALCLCKNASILCKSFQKLQICSSTNALCCQPKRRKFESDSGSQI